MSGSTNFSTQKSKYWRCAVEYSTPLPAGRTERGDSDLYEEETVGRTRTLLLLLLAALERLRCCFGFEFSLGCCSLAAAIFWRRAYASIENAAVGDECIALDAAVDRLLARLSLPLMVLPPLVLVCARVRILV